MSADALVVLRLIFRMLWQLFTSWHIPGTNVTPAGALVFFVFAPLVLKFIAHLFGMGGVFGGTVSRSASHIRSAAGSGSGSSGSGGSSGGGGKK